MIGRAKTMKQNTNNNQIVNKKNKNWWDNEKRFFTNDRLPFRIICRIPLQDNVQLSISFAIDNIRYVVLVNRERASDCFFS